jgi:hypothetical protein
VRATQRLKLRRVMQTQRPTCVCVSHFHTCPLFIMTLKLHAAEDGPDLFANMRQQGAVSQHPTSPMPDHPIAFLVLVPRHYCSTFIILQKTRLRMSTQGSNRCPAQICHQETPGGIYCPPPPSTTLQLSRRHGIIRYRRRGK